MATLSEGNAVSYTHRPNIVHLERNPVKLPVSSTEDTRKASHPSESNPIDSNKENLECMNLPTADDKVPNDQSELKIVEEPETPTIDIVINNVVCSFSVRCHLNLRQIALTGYNVEYRRENGMLTMKIRKPYTTASFWSSGKVTCTGATSEDLALCAARKFSRIIQKLGFRVRFSNYRVVNVLGTCSMPFGIKILGFSQEHRSSASYEPELHPGVTYKIKDIKATLKIFSTGSITITAPSVANVQLAVEHIFPLVYEYRKEYEIEPKTVITSSSYLQQKKKRAGAGGGSASARRHYGHDSDQDSTNSEDDARYADSDSDDDEMWD